MTRVWLLDLLDEAFDRKSWHGTNLRGSIRGLTPDVGAWRPAEGRHNIWELVVHAAYWKYAVRRRLTGEKRGSFPLEGSNWWARPQQGLAARGAGPAAFDEGGIPPDGVAPRSNRGRILTRRPLSAGRIARLGATRDVHHGLLALELRRDVALLVGEHARLRAAVEAFPAAKLGKPIVESGFTYIGLIRGAAAHDLYHAGQIQLIKRLEGA